MTELKIFKDPKIVGISVVQIFRASKVPNLSLKWLIYQSEQVNLLQIMTYSNRKSLAVDV